MTPTIQNSVNGQAAQPSVIALPNGLAMASTRNPRKYMIPATANCTRNFFPAPAPRRSS